MAGSESYEILLLSDEQKARLPRESHTPTPMVAPNTNVFYQIDRDFPAKDPLNKPVYSSEPMPVCKNSSIFPVTFHSPSELHLTAAKSSPEHTEATGRGSFHGKNMIIFVTVCGSALLWKMLQC